MSLPSPGDDDAGAFDRKDLDTGSRLNEFAARDDIDNGAAELRIATGTENGERNTVFTYRQRDGRINRTLRQGGAAGLLAPQGDVAEQRCVWQEARNDGERDGCQQDGDAQVGKRVLEHLARGDKRLVRIMVDHCPDDGGGYEEKPNQAGDDGAWVNDDLADDQPHADGKEDRNFPSGQAGNVASEKEEEKADRREKARCAKTADLQLDIDADDAAKEQDGRKSCQPESESLEASGDGAISWMAPVSPAFFTRSEMLSATPEARTGLPAITCVAS